MAEESSRAWKDQYMLRLPDGMRERIKAAAEASNRSMNAEIVAALEEKYPAPVAPPLWDALGKALDFLEGLTKQERDAFMKALPDKIQEANPETPPEFQEMLLAVFGKLRGTADKLDTLGP